MSPSQVEAANIEAAPLVDWTPEQQIAHMLELCEAQMESAMCESDLAVDSLIKAFSGLAESAQSLNAMAARLTPEQRKAFEGVDLKKQMESIERQMSSAIVAFQFYDKLTQRLGHVRYSLSTLALFVCDRTQTADPDQWDRLLKTLRRLYRTDEERQIFQMIIDGTPLESSAAAGDQGCEVELF